MTRPFLLRFGCLSLAAALAAASTPAAADDASALRELAAASTIPPEIRMEGGFPRTLRVDVGVVGVDPESMARDFLTRFAGLYGLTDPASELVLDRTETDGRLTHLFFVQRHQGWRVAGGEIAVHLSGDRVWSTNGHLKSGLGPVGAPRVPRIEAEKIALDTSGLLAPHLLAPARPVVLQVDGRAGPETRLAWEVQLAGSEDGVPVQVQTSIDAQDGAILELLSKVDTSLDLDVELAWNTTSDICWFFGGTTTWFDEDGATSSYSPALDTFDDGADTFNAVWDTYDFFDTQVSQTSYDDGDGGVNTAVHVGMNWDNASHVPNCGMLFGTGWAQLDVVAHEFTHAVDSHAQDLKYQNQSGALDESFADVFGVLIDGDDPQMGDSLEGFNGSCPNSVAIRDLSDPPL
jgi:Zn-dependent metalloprotease